MFYKNIKNSDPGIIRNCTVWINPAQSGGIRAREEAKEKPEPFKSWRFS